VVLLLAVLGCKHARPTSEEARAGAKGFLRASALENCRTDSEMKRVLADAASAGGPVRRPSAGFVHQAGTSLVDGANQPLQLRGVNLGGVYLWEGWIWGGKLTLFHLARLSQTNITQNLTELLGPGDFSEFQRSIYDSYVSERDMQAAAAMGFNLVRVPFNHRLFTDPADPDHILESGFQVLDRVVDLAERAGIYVQLDLHAAPGGQNAGFISDPDKLGLWDSPEDQRRTVALWKAIAAHYANRPTVAAYDLLNEPSLPRGHASELVALYSDIIGAIRSVDRNHLVMLEGDTYATDFSMFSKPLDANQAYSFHLYTWINHHPASTLASLKRLSEQQGIPIHCGEFGEADYGATRELVSLFNDPGSGVSGWAYWTWKRARSSTHTLNEIVPPEDWLKTINWIADP
jgi:aryl-phospho-beta-D-glucosidase BglC (GH1 family)